MSFRPISEKLLPLFLIFFIPNVLFAQQVNKALDLFLNNKMNEAVAALTKISNEATNKERGKAAIGLALIHKLNDNADDKVKYFVQGLKYLSEPDAYAYTLWGDCYFYNYPRYAKELKEVFAAKSSVHPDINYCLDNLVRRQFILNNQFDSVLSWNNRRGVISQWDLLGPFDYSDGYGFHNDEQTLNHSDYNFTFTGRFNAKLNWFPLIKNVNTSDFYLNEFIDITNYSAAKAYLQTFLFSDIDQEIHLTFISGTEVRCWLNDALVFENRRNIENISSLPFHLPVKLKKGNNRLLFQIGKKMNYASTFEAYIRDKQDRPLTNVQIQLKERNYVKENNVVAVVKDPDIESFNVRIFSDYIKKNPGDILEQMLRIEELNSTGDKTKTLNALEALHQKYPNSYYLSNLFYNNKENVNYSTRDKFLNENCENCYSTLSQKYDEAVEEKNKDEIAGTLAKLEKNFPGNISVLYRKIDYLMDKNEYAEASRLIEEGLQKYENFLVFNSYKNSLLKAQARKAEILAFLKSILPGRNNTFVNERLKSYYLEENDTLNWIEVHKNDLVYDKSDENYYSLLAMYNSSKRYGEAESLIKEFLLKKPFDADVWEEYGDLMAEIGQKEKAIEYFRKSLSLQPLSYEVIKKINTNMGLKPEIELLLSQTMKELFKSAKVDKIEVPQHLSNKNWVILFRKSASVMYEGGLNVSKNFVFYKITKEAGITEFKEFSASSMGSDVMIFKEDGQVVLPESGYGSMVLPNLKVGDIIGLKYENENSANAEYHTSRYKEILTSLDNEPMVILEEDLLISKSFKEEPLVFDKKKSLKIDKSEWNQNFNLYKVTAKHPRYIEPELAPADLLFNNTSVVMHNYKSWDEVAKWYWEIASPKLVSDDNLKKIVKDVLKGNENASSYRKAELLYKWIVQNINYSSQSFRQDNYVPQLPSKVLADKLGDCKDLAALYIVMCNEIGIKARFCLVNMDYRAALYRRFPNINFNHCIAKIYPDNTPLYIELTSKFLPFAQSVNYTTYGYGLEIDSQSKCDISEMYNDGHFDYFKISSRLIKQDEKLKIEGSIKFSGVTCTIIKDAFQKIDSSQINTSLKQLVSSFIPNNNFDSCQYNSKETNPDTIVISYKLSNNDIFTDVADLHVYKLPAILTKIVDEGIFANSERKTDLSLLSSLSMIEQSHSESIISIPANKKVLKMPENGIISNAFFDYSLNISEKGRELSIDRRFKIKTRVIAAADFPKYKEEMEKAYKLDLITVVLQ